MSLLSISGLNKMQAGNAVLNDVSLVMHKGEKLVIAGETGSGKTTLLKMIAGLDQPTGGTIYFNNTRVKGADEQLLPGHPQIGYLSQHFELRNNYWVWEELNYMNELDEEKAAALYDICRIGHLLKRRTNQLSGGERQRVTLARLLGASPSLLLLDEPFSNLDAIHKSVIKSVINDISVKLSIDIIMVLHEASDMLPWANRMLVLRNGMVVQDANPLTIYHQPANEYCAALLGYYSLWKEDSTGDKRRFLRPEYVQINEKKGELTGTVSSRKFYGSHFLYQVKTPGGNLLARSLNADIEIDSSVNLSIDDERRWYI